MKGEEITINNILGERVRQLFINVVLRAVKDAFYTKNTETTLLQKEQALNWLCNGSEDFYEVCTYAGLDGNSVRRKAQFLSKIRSDKKNKYLKKLLDPYLSEYKKKEILLDSLAYKKEFLFLELAQSTKEKPEILKKAFDLCEKGHISIKMIKNGNKMQYFATGEKI